MNNFTLLVFKKNEYNFFKFLLLFFFTTAINQMAFGQSAGFNTSYIVMSINGGGNAYYDLQASTGNLDFNGANLGTFCQGNTTGIVFKGAEHNVYKCGGCDLTSTRVYYRIYPTGSPSGSFVSNAIGYSSGFGNGCGGQDQQWSNTGYTTDILSGLSAGNYTIEVYSDASITCSGGTAYATNSGNNYKATFTVNGTSIGGSVSGGTSICDGSTSGLLSLSGNTGNVIRWESSVSPFSSWTTIANTSTTYTSGALTQTTKFRAVVKNGVCSEIASSDTTVTVNPIVTASVSTAVVPTGAICSGTSVTFTATPTNGGTTPTYQWKINGTDVSGETASTFTSTVIANNDVVTVVMTSNENCVTGSPATSTGITMTVTSSAVASVNIAAVPTGAICSGTSVTFTATPTNGGGTPTYQWKINGTDVSGETASTFTSTALANNDVVTVVMTSNLACATGSPATSTGITMTVNSSVAASVSTAVVPTGAICAGTSVTFTATPSNGGTTPTYQWKINGTDVSGETATTFSSTTFANNDVVTVVMTSNEVCVTGSPATSTGITMTVNPNVTASVSSVASPSGAICVGTSVTFTATPTNGGTTPTYQWKINGTDVSGETATTFTSTTLANNDVVTVVMTSNANCVTGSPATSSGTTMTVNAFVTASVSTAVVPTGAICSGTSVTFTATPTNGGTTPTYQWKINGTDVSGETASTFTSTTLANNDIVSVEMVSNANCVSGSPATSTGITMTVTSNVSASVSTTVVPTGAICTGTSVTFTATPTNGGTTPTYQWKINGTDVSGETASTFTSTTLANNDVVTVVMTSNETCVTGSPATSSGITMSVSDTINYLNLQYPSSATICNGDSVLTFGQLFEPGVTPGSNSQGAGITAEFGFNSSDTDPSTWTNWSSTTFNGLGGGVNNDEYMYNFTPASVGTYYYTFRFKQGACDWQYGGYSGSGGGTWNGTSNVSGILTVIAAPTASISSNNGPTVCNNSSVTFDLSGSNNAIVTYNLNGGSNTTVTLTGGIATVSVSNATANQTLNLVSVANGGCTVSLSATSTVNIGSATTWDGTSWSNLAPTATSSVTFTGNYTIGANFDACTITVDNNAVVSVTSNFNVTLNGAINVITGSFTLNNNANLLQLTNVSNSGNIIVKRNSNPLMRLDYTLWSAPVSGQNLQAFSPSTLANRFYTYTTSTNLYSVVASPSTTSFALGKGYLIRTPNTFALTPTIWPGSFTGVPNNGTINVSLTNIGVGQRLNAIGNPYPSPIDMNEFVSDNSANITGTLYFWRKTNSTSSSPGYCTWTAGTFVTNNEAQVNDPNDVIRTGQGFIVEATATGSNVEFNNSQRIGDTANQIFKADIERNRMWLNVTDTNGGFSQMAIGYIEGATQGVDAFDGKFLSDGTIALNSIINNTNYVIQGKSLPFNTNDVVPLSFKTATAGNHTISIDHLDGFFSGSQRIFLKDKTNNNLYDLKAASYTFTSDAGTFNNRFEIVYINVNQSDVQASQCGNTLATVNQSIYSNLISGAQGYRFRVTDATTNQVQTIDKALRTFQLSQLSNYAFNRTYFVEVAVKKNNVWQPFGNACSVTTPIVTTKVQSSQCGSTVAFSTIIYADLVALAPGYRFRITNLTTNVQSVFDRPIRDVKLSLLSNPQYGTNYSIEVAVKNTDGTYLPYGTSCVVTTSLTSNTKIDFSSNNESIFNVTAYPNPFNTTFSLNVESNSSELIEINSYDMVGKQIESKKVTISENKTIEIGSNYSSGIYNIIISQGDKNQVIKMIKD